MASMSNRSVQPGGPRARALGQGASGREPAFDERDERGVCLLRRATALEHPERFGIGGAPRQHDHPGDEPGEAIWRGTAERHSERLDRLVPDLPETRLQGWAR